MGDDNGLVMDYLERRQQLGRFLRQCRERLSPQAAGLPMTGRRRTPGLRREEVAMLTGISTTYYTKIEQGRVDVSERALCAIAVTLQLNHTEQNYVFALASGRPTAAPAARENQISPALSLFLELQNPYPAQVLDRYWEFLAWNEATCATLGDLDALPPQMRNLVVMVFTMPQMRQSFADWEANARNLLGEFRANYGKYHDDPRFGQLIAFLMDNSAEFKEWWTEQKEVGSRAEFEKVMIHPFAGELSMVETMLSVNDNPGQRVLIFLPQDEETKQKMQQLYEMRVNEQGRSQEGAGSGLDFLEGARTTAVV